MIKQFDESDRAMPTLLWIPEGTVGTYAAKAYTIAYATRRRSVWLDYETVVRDDSLWAHDPDSEVSSSSIEIRALAWTITKSGTEVYFTVGEHVRRTPHWHHLSDAEAKAYGVLGSIFERSYVSPNLGGEIDDHPEKPFASVQLERLATEGGGPVTLPLAHYIAFERMWPEFVKRYRKWTKR